MPIYLLDIFKKKYFEKKRFRHLIEEYDGCSYELSICLDTERKFIPQDYAETLLNNSKKLRNPWFDSITIESPHGKTEILSLDKPVNEVKTIDVKHAAELIFLLALKLKYDFLTNKLYKKNEEAIDFYNFGLLHTNEIINLKGRTEVYPTIWRQLYYKLTQNSVKNFTFLSKLDHLYHFIGYFGNVGTEKGLADVFGWINVSPENIKCLNKNNKQLEDKELHKILNIFFQNALLSTSELQPIYQRLGIRRKISKDVLPSLESEPKEGKQKYEHPSDLRLKYFSDMCDVLKWDNKKETPQWFRKSGPIAVDFRANIVYERKELLDKLEEFVSNNKISMLEGHGGSGKSVLIRNFAYRIIETNKSQAIYLYSFKTDLPIIDFHEFLQVLKKISGIVILEDIHLAARNVQSIVDKFPKE